MTPASEPTIIGRVWASRRHGSTWRPIDERFDTLPKVYASSNFPAVVNKTSCERVRNNSPAG